MIDMTNITALPSGNFRVRLEYRGEVLGGTFATADEAIDVRDMLKRRIVDGDLRPSKGASAIDLGPRFLASRSGNRSVSDDEGRWHLRIVLASWARRPVTSVTRKDGLEWLAELKKERTAYDAKIHGARRSKPISWGLRRHYLNLARRFFQWCVDDEELLTANPFAGLSVEREDGDEDEGYQEDWYLDVEEQKRLFDLWTDLPTLDPRDRLERFIYGVALWSGIRLQEAWCLHLTDFHVGVDEPRPHLVVRYGSWDPIKERYRSPKGRKGEKKRRVVDLWGFGLECARNWMAVRDEYLRMNPRTERERAAKGYQGSPLVFPTERGRRRDAKPPRSWKKVSDAFGVVPRIGEKPWWHLLRHSCASSLISSAWGDVRYELDEVQQILGHTDIRTTQRYAHHLPRALQAKAAKADAAFRLAKVIPIGRHAAVTALRDDRGEAGNSGHAREDSNLRPTAPEHVGTAGIAHEIARRDGVVTAIRHVLALIADKKLSVPVGHVLGLQVALDEALDAYQRAAAAAAPRGSR